MLRAFLISAFSPDHSILGKGGLAMKGNVIFFFSEREYCLAKLPTVVGLSAILQLLVVKLLKRNRHRTNMTESNKKSKFTSPDWEKIQI